MPSQRRSGEACCARSVWVQIYSTIFASNFTAAHGVSCQATTGPAQKQRRKPLQPGLPDICELSPQLQQEWHPDNNALLGGIKVKPNSGKRVMWSCTVCPNCPAGIPHVWEIAVGNRTRGSKCPYCAGKTVCQHSSLATKAPSQMQY